VVDGGQRRAGDQIGGAGADGRGDGLRGEPARLAGVADGRMDHGLFVAALEIGHVALGLEQCLAHARHVPVAEDAPCGADEPVAAAVALGVLAGEERDEGLGRGQPSGGHR
jgi:hypothetical protein